MAAGDHAGAVTADAGPRRSALGRPQVAVVEARHGEEALAVWADRSGLIHLLLTDGPAFAG